GVVGVSFGLVAVAALIVPIALTVSKFGKSGVGGPATRDYLRYLLPLAVGQLFLNFLLQTDFFLFKRFVGDSIEAHRLVPACRGVRLCASLPYQLLISITFILFPMLARAKADGDRDAIKRYTMTGVRIAFLLTGMLSGLVAGLAPHLLHVVYPADTSIWAVG